MCHHCRFLVDAENHEDHCQTMRERAPLAELPTGNRENQEPAATVATGAEAAITAATTNAVKEAREELDNIRTEFLVLQEDVNCTTTLTQRLRVTQRDEAQAGQERHQATQQELQQVTQDLEGFLQN
jgi:PHP family Zn ribbon phosphoesterase